LKNRFQNWPFKFNLQRYSTVVDVATAPNAVAAAVADIPFSKPAPVTLSLATNAGSDGGYFAGNVRITRLPQHGALYRGGALHVESS
jgi:hypothetical protein